jgi:hypothetical protein
VNRKQFTNGGVADNLSPQLPVRVKESRFIMYCRSVSAGAQFRTIFATPRGGLQACRTRSWGGASLRSHVRGFYKSKVRACDPSMPVQRRVPGREPWMFVSRKAAPFIGHHRAPCNIGRSPGPVFGWGKTLRRTGSPLKAASSESSSHPSDEVLDLQSSLLKDLFSTAA